MRLAVLAQTQGDLVLLFDGQQQRLAGIGQPGRLLSLAASSSAPWNIGSTTCAR